MNMQQMMMQAQKMQRDLKKAMDELHQKEFFITKGGAVKVGMMGDKSISEITIDKDAFDPENKDMIEEMLIMAINELQETISKEEESINQKITGQAGGLGGLGF